MLRTLACTSLLLSFLSLLSTSACTSLPKAADPPAPAFIVNSPGKAPLEALAARELRRYIYLRSGELLPIVEALPAGGQAILIRTDSTRLRPQQYRLETTRTRGRTVLTITGGSPVATMYGAYHYVEKLGVRFYLHGDVIPEARIPFSLRQLEGLDETHEPLFELRGIQPFHDFTEGPDWWNADDHKAHLSQLAKLRMNFYGLHCYPEGGVGPEPLVWIGLEQDLDVDETGKAKVRFSYPSRWASTLGGAWGYASTKTSDFAAGAGLLFDQDDFGPEVTSGFRPMPKTPEDCNEVFRRTGAMLKSAFAHGRALGIKICMGTQTPLTIPNALAEHLQRVGLDPRSPEGVRRLYQGMFTRIARVHPIDYYWLWTPEGWTWSGTKQEQVDATLGDIGLALEALGNIGRPFALATCGWVLGPPDDRALFDKTLPKDVPISCINRQVGFAPVEPGFARVEGRAKWAIPWMEDDPAMIIPQLWAGRMRRDAADAHGYGCTGLMGIHWRTKVLSANVAALAAAAWNQSSWNPDLGRRITPPLPSTADVHVGGNTASFAGHPIAETDEDPVYQTCRWNLRAYRLKIPNGQYAVTLKFCEPHYKEAGKRVFGVKLQGKLVANRLDVCARVGPDRPLDLHFESVVVRDGGLAIEFVKQVEFPFIAGIEVQGGGGYARKINCAGSKWRDFEADLPPMGAEQFPNKPRDLPIDDFYRDWCLAQFGPEVAPALASLFTRLDGGGNPSGSQRTSHLPRPSMWIRGPGGIPANPKPWEEEKSRYAFVEEMAALRPKIRGPGELDRFDYWLDTFRYLRVIGRLSCMRGRLDGLVKQMGRETFAQDALGVRRELARLWEKAMTLQLAVASTPGELGTIANLEQHVRRGTHFLDLHDKKIAAALGEELPSDVEPSLAFGGKARILVPTKRSLAQPGESIALRVIILSKRRPKQAALYWRPMGRGLFGEIELEHVARAVYTVKLPPMTTDSVEYYIRALGVGAEDEDEDGDLVWPPTAPRINQTVVLGVQTTSR